MVGLLVFAATLLVAVLVSGLAHRTVLSTAVLFLVAGFVAGEGVSGALSFGPNDNVVELLAELALFSVLFTDGMRVGIRDLATAWRLPGRALLLGLPLTLALTAALAHFVAGLPWTQAFLVGAVLSPTDPVFAAAIVGREEVPARIRRLLNVESGLNDGLALPVVIVLLAVAGRGELSVPELAWEVALGVVIGIAIPWVAIRLERSRFFAASTAYEPLNAFAIGILVLGVAFVTDANEFLAAFAAGVTVASTSPQIRDAFRRFGELVTELLKLAALLVFGALMSPAFLAEIPPSGYVFALLAIVAVRPVALGTSLAGSGLERREFVTAAWFGPKGFASVVYGLLILRAGAPQADEMFHLVALVIAGSILAHSSTDVLIARWFRQEEAEDRAGESAVGDSVGDPERGEGPHERGAEADEPEPPGVS
ncbi:MAG TPA: cation:proton antiporter [Actinomycetota bacterium]|nr:cation:proton antiporter [Actinomycetota bacterium]